MDVRIQQHGTAVEVVMVYSGTEIRFAGPACGIPLAAEALAQVLRQAFEQRIERIRREAYEQGARDRARRAKHFAGVFRNGMNRGGCYP